MGDYEYHTTTTPPRRVTYSSSSSSAPTTSIHVTALDGIVSVNSLFTVAVFIGLSVAEPGKKSLEGRPECDAGNDIGRHLVLFEVFAFSCFLFSSLVAKGLKLSIVMLNSKDVDEVFKAHINSNMLRLGMMASTVGSVIGCIFLLLSMLNIIQIRIGLLSCGSRSAALAALALVVLVSSGLAVYISTVVHAFRK